VEKLRTDVKGVTQTDRERPKLFPSSGGGDESEFLSVRSIHTVLHHDRKTVRKKPSFALRALVQERFAEIIAADIAGYQSCIEIKEYTLSVTIDTLKETAEKWLVPRRARKAFRAVAFEALYFVGEHGLITRGPDALFALTPFEFHEIFSPLLAAFGDAETMELWLERTQALAEVDLSPSFTPPIAAVVAARLPSSIATTVPDGPTSITKIAPSDGATASSHLKDEPCVEADTVVENSSTTATTTLGSKGDTKVELPDIT
jgi:hypothetical protein